MVYIYEKKIGKIPYYYLRLDTLVKGKKIVKDIAYLGNDLSKVNIESLLKDSKYKEEIKKSYKTITKFLNSKYYLDKAQKKKLKKDKFITKEQQIKLEAMKLHFKDRFLKLDKQTQKDIYDSFIVSFAYNTTSIEGNTIPLIEASRILNEGYLPKNRTLREVYDLRNTKDTFFYLLTKKILDKKLIIDIHDRLLKDIDERKGFRNFDIRITFATFKSSHYYFIEKEIDSLLNWLKENSKIHIFALCAMIHHKFERIHPFADGNGRTGRMIINFMLIKAGYPPIIITKKHRKEYLDALLQCDKKNNYLPLIEFMLKEYENNYWENFNV